MPKPRMAKGLEPEMPVGLMAERFLLAKLRELRGSAGQALAGEVEGVHDMRIASKRLREALRLFRPLLPKRRGQEALAAADEINDALGRVRDPDVMLEHLAALAGEVPEAGEPAAALQAAWQEQRTRAHADLGELWERLNRKDRLREQLRELAAATGARDKAPNRLAVARFACLCVSARAGKAREGLELAGDSTDAAALHRARILVKRLKYTLEPFLGVLPRLRPPYVIVAEVQESLGLVHDSDVLQGAIGEVLGGSRTLRTQAGRRLLEALDAERARHQAAAHDQAAALLAPAWMQTVLDAMD